MPKPIGNKVVIWISLLGIFIFVLYILLTFSLWNSEGRTTPIGEDFSIFWTASALSLAGEPKAAYDPAKLQSAQMALLGKATPAGCGWYYPPIFLLMVLPLALFPYLVSLGLWLAITISGYLLVMRRIAPHPLTIGLTLAFPATLWNLYYAQNAFFSAAFLGGGLLLLDRFPVLAGILLGAMSYKPQLAFLIPIALLAGRRWKALVATISSAIFLTLISILVFGPEVWIAFFEDISLHKQLFESARLIKYQFVPTVFSTALSLGVEPTTAYILQIMVMLVVISAVARVWWIEGTTPISASVLVLGILLFSHFYAGYDLALLALPLAWLGWEGFRKGWLPGEKIMLALGWIMPLPLNSLWGNIQGVVILMGLFVFALRRFYRSDQFYSQNNLII